MEEQKKIAREVSEKVKKERDQYKGYGNLQNFSRGEKLENEKLADKVFKKVKIEEDVYKKISKNVEKEVKGEEEWVKKVVKMQRSQFMHIVKTDQKIRIIRS